VGETKAHAVNTTLTRYINSILFYFTSEIWTRNVGFEATADEAKTMPKLIPQK
jgi:hypothetical protein